jgi:hypothetical protein
MCSVHCHHSHRCQCNKQHYQTSFKHLKTEIKSRNIRNRGGTWKQKLVFTKCCIYCSQASSFPHCYKFSFNLLPLLKGRCTRRLMRSPSCPCVSPPYQLLNQLIDFHEIQWGWHTIEVDLDAVVLNVVAATIPKWRTFKILGACKTCTILHRAMKLYIVIVFQRVINFNKTIFVKNEKYSGLLKFKVNILFYGDNPWTVVLR